jgi:hypothetical protein
MVQTRFFDVMSFTILSLIRYGSCTYRNLLTATLFLYLIHMPIANVY